jgi:pimeloyl-ACP methyl ester carboxylesterase
VAVRRRAITNGSIYMDLVQLSAGQRFLLAMADEPADVSGPDAFGAALMGTMGPDPALAADELEAQWLLASRDEGHRLLPRTIRYVEDRRLEGDRYTGAIETHPSPLTIVWGAADPIAVVAMAHRLHERVPGSSLTVLDDVGHFPMVEAPARWADAVVAGLAAPAGPGA